MRPLRRTDRALSSEIARQLLEQGEFGVLASADAGGQPYATPLSYVLIGDGLYVHCAREGRKLDNLAANPRVCFCVVGRTEVLPAEFATRYESVLAFGSAAEVEGAEKSAALRALAAKYSPGYPEDGERYIERHQAATRVIRIHIDEVSGKARR